MEFYDGRQTAHTSSKFTVRYVLYNNLRYLTIRTLVSESAELAEFRVEDAIRDMPCHNPKGLQYSSSGPMFARLMRY